MAMVSHFLKLIQFISLFSVSTLSWPPPFYFWPLFFFGQFLNFRFLGLAYLGFDLFSISPANYSYSYQKRTQAKAATEAYRNTTSYGCISCLVSRALTMVYTSGRTYHGSEFPFGTIKDPQYVGSIMSLLACIAWVPFLYIFLWALGYVFMMHVESKEDPASRAKPLFLNLIDSNCL